MWVKGSNHSMHDELTNSDDLMYEYKTRWRLKFTRLLHPHRKNKNHFLTLKKRNGPFVDHGSQIQAASFFLNREIQVSQFEDSNETQL